ncbi:MAG: hypothetical protein WD872_17570 [Pirellulaceae bacterium]
MSEVAVTTSRTPGRRRWPRWIGWALWSVLGLAFAACLVTFATLQFGAVHGVELNPYTFARRSYSFYEVPLIRWQVRGIRREDVASDAVAFLDQQKYVAPAKAAPGVWHVVTASRGIRPPAEGDAEILVRYLDARDAQNNPLWVQWSKEHPKLAGTFWPAVSRLAQEDLYVFVPDLFELAAGATDPLRFQTELNEQLAERLATSAQ